MQLSWAEKVKSDPANHVSWFENLSESAVTYGGGVAKRRSSSIEVGPGTYCCSLD
jgi:hypothetical protein